MVKNAVFFWQLPCFCVLKRLLGVLKPFAVFFLGCVCLGVGGFLPFGMMVACTFKRFTCKQNGLLYCTMDNAGYVTLSKQRMLFQQMDIIAGNVSNANTVGFKGQETLFDQYLVEGAAKQGSLAFVHNLSTVNDFGNGPLQMTKRPLDMAIQGEGFFMVETPLGVRYTRAGNFMLDGNNELTTVQGYPVLGAGGQRVGFQEGDTDVQVFSDGRITANGADRGAVGVMTFDNLHVLEKMGNGLFQTEQLPRESDNFVLAQGMLEGANVSSVAQITDMVQTSRAVGTTSGLIADLDEMQRSAMRTIANQGN